ncbi:MAG: site-2 protease family protein [Gammaproteobacteria bacterium]|jgi:Zn-dependent protease|nr:MAG: site-2 protease family protein [Gammaproteobacteria bacterium]
MKLFTLFGIEIRLDFSVIFIFGLIVYSLGVSVFPSWHPNWPAATIWSMALLAGLLFFASLLAHEMSHSLVAQRFGIRVPRITLFLFGGMAEIETEARTPGAEFAIAIAGPLMSLAIAFVCLMYASSTIDEALLEVFMEDPETAMENVGPLVTVCLWLGTVNMMLAIFNMVPGFPLDGGRVARAIVWRLTGDRVRATRVAASAGRVFGWCLMGLGFWELLVLKSMGGLWLILIGWFLSHLATQSYAQVVTQNALAPHTVADLMRTHFERVDADASVAHFVDECLLRSSQLLWPVMAEGRCIGTASLEEVLKLPVENRASTRVGDIALSLADSGALDAGTSAPDAMGLLASRQDRPVPVLRGGEVVGLLRGADVLKWLTLQGGLGRLDS